MFNLQGLIVRFRIIRELFAFLWRRKLWWLFPLVLLVVLLGLLIAFGTSTGIGPFIYTVF